MTRDVDDLLGAQGAGEHPDQGEPPDIGVTARANDFGDERTVRVARQPGDIAAGGRGGCWRRARCRRRERRLDELEDLFHADTGRRRDGQDGEERALADRRLGIGDELGDVEVLTGQVAVQQRVVLGLLDDRLDERAALLLNGGGFVLGGIAAAARAVGDVLADEGHRPDDRLVVGVDRQVDRLGVAEDPAAGGDGVGIVRPRHVQLAHGDDPRHTDGCALLPQQGGRAVDAVRAGDDEDGRVGGAQPRAQLADEVGVSGGVDEVDRQPAALDGGNLDAHGASVLALVGPSTRHARRDQVLEEGGFARTAGADEHDIADLLGARGDRCGRQFSGGGCFAHGLHLSLCRPTPQGDRGPASARLAGCFPPAYSADPASVCAGLDCSLSRRRRNS
ncbi:MAG: hypothetical protein BWY91_02385 [bacterium ADurb.BinA028]|nr:MAG: hypothetical protein BWY91_02385 [bacterium ADurb.BinA028]